MPRAGLALAFALLASGCAGIGVQIGSPEPAAAPAPAPAVSKQAAAEEAAIQAALQRVQSKKGPYAVSPEGTITMPLIGEVKVGGLSVAEAEQAILAKLKRYVVEPHVSVFIREYGNKQVYVLGEVQKPGSYALPTEARLTVIEAVTLAGGFTQFASQDRTRVIRTAGGKSENIIVEVTAVTKRGDKSKDVQLEPNDVVFVPESFF